MGRGLKDGWVENRSRSPSHISESSDSGGGRGESEKESAESAIFAILSTKCTVKLQITTAIHYLPMPALPNVRQTLPTSRAFYQAGLCFGLRWSITILGGLFCLVAEAVMDNNFSQPSAITVPSWAM